MVQKNIKNYILLQLQLIIGVIFFTLFFAPTVFAQSAGTVIRTVPESARADQEFSVSLASSDIDLNRAHISWYLNEKLGLEGVGKIGFTSRTGPVGTEFRVRAVIEPATGGTIVRTTVVRPQEIDFLWRAHSYTPPFYEGRSLAPSAGFVVVTAMPNMADGDGNLLDPSDLIYTWSERGIVLGDASGYGQQTIVLENAQIPERLLQLNVSVSSRNNVVSASESIVIPLTEPRILFYEKSPLEGVLYNHILRNIELEKDEIVVRAEPYFFSLDDVQNDLLLYEWQLNGEQIKQGSRANQQEMTFRKEGARGAAKIAVEILNDNLPLRIMQQAMRSFNIDIK